ncbi:MAG: hypothetical protein GX417_07515 [Clostridiales bacterium]|nr:hypothetical protein [Clostridiales bacterium]
MMIIWLLLIGVVLYVLLSKPANRAGGGTKTVEDPVELLKKRFVNGEITEEEYKKMLKLVND